MAAQTNALGLATRSFSSGPPVEFSHHGAAQDRVHAGLITLTSGLQPCQHIGIQSRRNLLLDRTIEPAPDRPGPLLVGQLGNVAGVDLIGRQRVQPGKFLAPLVGQLGQRIEGVFNHWHIASFPSG